MVSQDSSLTLPARNFLADAIRDYVEHHGVVESSELDFVEFMVVHHVLFDRFAETPHVVL